MRELYALELVRLVKELKQLEGFHIDQFYELGRNRFRLKLSRRGEKANLQCILPYAINRTDTIEIKEEATNFSLAMRKRIGGARIRNIKQLNNDRIISMALDISGDECTLIFEMFGRGNMALADINMKIMLAYQLHDFKDRSIRPDRVYNPPENTALDINDKDTMPKLEKEMQASDTGILNYLMKRLGMGKIYVKESLTRAAIDEKTKAKDLSANEIKKLSASIADTIDECMNRPAFLAYIDNGLKNFSICKISEYSKLESNQFDSLEKCLDFVYQNARPEGQQRNEEEEKLLASIGKQRKIIEGIDDEIMQNKKRADYIMSRMHGINAIINAIRSDKSITKEELQHMSEEIEILSIDMKNKIIKIKEKG